MFMSNVYWFPIALIFIFSYISILCICRIFFYKKWVKFILQNLVFDLFLVAMIYLPNTRLEALNVFFFIFLICCIFIFIQWIKSKTIGMNFSIKSIMIEIWIIIIWIIWLWFIFVWLFQLKPELVRPYNIAWYSVSK